MVCDKYQYELDKCGCVDVQTPHIFRLDTVKFPSPFIHSK